MAEGKERERLRKRRKKHIVEDNGNDCVDAK